MSDSNVPVTPQNSEGGKNLLDSATNVQDILDVAEGQAAEAPVTEVTSIANEELKTGQKVNIPGPEELVARATASYHRNITMLTNLVKARNGGSYRISRKGMNRILSSIVQMPTDGLPVALQGEEEKLAFELGQKVLMDRYIITHYHIVQEQKRIKDEQEKQKAAAQTEAQVNNEVKTEEKTDENKIS